MPEKKKYVAVVGISFDGLKDQPRVEPGEAIPDAVSADEIKALLADGHIKVQKEK